ncbi:MAG: hypothetical protein PW792_04160 [Acidobacteriaceae bacterium]|nr:hypothetical protein [Acidobacteriaceae bacterium]
MKKVWVAVFSVMAAATVVSAQTPQASNVRGKVTKVTGSTFTLTTNAGQTLSVKAKPGFKVYDRLPSDLSHVKDAAFVGVTSVKGADGKEHATEIHIFPEELRGLGEGSHMMDGVAGAAHGSRMSNGAVAQAHTSVAPATHSRMSNGAIAKTGSGSLQVKFAGGSTDVIVPPDVKVTEIKAVPHALAVGDVVFVAGSNGANGAVLTGGVLLVHP